MASQTNTSEFPALERVAQVVDQLDSHRQRQVLAFVFERYGWNLQPAGKRTTATPSVSNRSEFAAIEEISEELDPLTPDQQRQAVTLLAARFKWEFKSAYKPPSRGFAPRRKFTRG